MYMQLLLQKFYKLDIQKVYTALTAGVFLMMYVVIASMCWQG